jgi:hypothetical protein
MRGAGTNRLAGTAQHLEHPDCGLRNRRLCINTNCTETTCRDRRSASQPSAFRRIKRAFLVLTDTTDAKAADGHGHWHIRAGQLWIPTATGIEIHVRDYQFGHGLPVVTIPWTDLNDVLSPTCRSRGSNR